MFEFYSSFQIQKLVIIGLTDIFKTLSKDGFPIIWAQMCLKLNYNKKIRSDTNIWKERERRMKCTAH